MGSFRLVRLTASGLKSADLDLTFGPVVVIRGVNGSGKTACLQGLALLATGSAPGVPSNSEGVLRLARGDEISVKGWFETSTGETLTAERTWRRDDKGAVRTSCSGTMVPKGKGARDGAALLGHRLGGWAEGWRPGDLTDLSPDKLRRRILQLVGGDSLALERWVPANGPPWSRAREGEDAADWVARVVDAAKKEVLSQQKELRELEAALQNSESAVERSADPVRERLRNLRAEYGAAQSAALGRAKAHELSRRLEGLSASLDPTAPWVPEAKSLLEEAHHAKRRAYQSNAIGARIRQRGAELARVDAWLEEAESFLASEAVDTATEAEVIEAKQIADATQIRLTGARRRVADARAQLTVLDPERQISVCPTCGADLLRHLASLRSIAQAAFDAAMAECRDAELDQVEAENDVAHMTEVVRATVERDRERAEKRALKATLEAEIAQLRAELAELGGDGACTADDLIVVAKARLKLAEAQDRLRAEIERVQADIAGCIVADTTTREPAAIDADIATAESELGAIGQGNERAQARRKLLEDIADVSGFVESAKASLAAFRRIEVDILDTVRTRLEGPLSQMAGAPVTIELVDARGNPTCRFAQDGIDVSTLSGGERLMFTAALLVALGKASSAEWRPLLLDGFEQVSADNREAFLRATVEAVASGATSQALLAGCPDGLPNIEGVRVIDLGAAEAVRAEVAA